MLFRSLLLSSIFPSIGVFSNESALHIRWPKYWSFSFNIIPSIEHPGLISFRIDWLDLLAVQGTLKSSPTPQFKSFNSLVLSFLYSPTLTSLLFNMLSRLFITFLPRNKRLLISWLLRLHRIKLTLLLDFKIHVRLFGKVKRLK